MYAHNKILNIKGIYSEEKVSFLPLFPAPPLWLPVVLVSCTSFETMSTIFFSVAESTVHAALHFPVLDIDSYECKQQQQ